MTKREKQKSRKSKGRKNTERLNALAWLVRIFDILSKFVLSKILLRKIGKDGLNKNRSSDRSKVCAGNTCTPCEGFATPSTPHAVGGAHARKRRRFNRNTLSPMTVKTTPAERRHIKRAAKRAGLSISAYVRLQLFSKPEATARGEVHV